MHRRVLFCVLLLCASVFGLAAATQHVPVGPGTNTARQRLRLEPAPPAPSSE